MRQEIKTAAKEKVLSLIADITYAQVEGWCSVSYRDLKLDVICPRIWGVDDRLPTIVWLCGGGFFCMDKNYWLPTLTELARRGFVIASPEYRLSGETAYPGPLQDIKAAIRYLRANADKYLIDPERIYVMGESAGGTYAVLCSVTNGDKKYDVGGHLDYSSDVQAAVDFYGLTDFEQYRELMDTSSDDITARAASYFRTQVEEGSAIAHVDGNTPPTLIFHGTADSIVSIEQSERYYEKLQQAGVRSDLYILEGAAHSDDAFYQKEIFDIIDNFLNDR